MKVMNNIDMQGQKITNLGDPSNPTDTVNLQYLQNFIRGLRFKDPVRVASTANVNIASPGASIDGVALSNGDSVLLKDQSTPSQNGIYLWNGAASAMTRRNDANDTGELAPGTTVTVTEGTVNADKMMVLISDAAITIGTTAQSWGPVGGGGTSYTEGDGIDIVGGQISVDLKANGGLSISGGELQVDANIVARKFSQSIGNGSSTSIAVTHNLGTKDVVVSFRQNSDDSYFLTDWVATDINTVTATFAVAPTSNQHRITVVG